MNNDFFLKLQQTEECKNAPLLLLIDKPANWQKEGLNIKEENNRVYVFAQTSKEVKLNHRLMAKVAIRLLSMSAPRKHPAKLLNSIGIWVKRARMVLKLRTQQFLNSMIKPKLFLNLRRKYLFKIFSE